jgi:hypothetical protein
MARRGQFGHLPRAVPSLTATILAIGREMAAREASDIMSAWQNGGLFDGKKVTDAKVLAFWAERLSGLDKGDPMYDEVKNTHDQLDYAIHESRVRTEYAQGKLSDTQVAHFYLGWAKKVPKDSEFWRTLQKDAAQFTQAAAARGRGRASQGKADAYAAAEADITKRHIALGDGLVKYLTQVARDNNLIGQNEGLDKFQLAGENDPGQMEELLKLVSAYPPAVAYIKQLDPTFDGNLTTGYLSKALADEAGGYAQIAARATKDGYSGKATAANKAADKAAGLGADIGSWPVAASYAVARAAFDAVWNSPGATDADKAAAAERFAKQIDKFSVSKGLTQAQSNRLSNDAAALRGDPAAGAHTSFNEDFLGRKTSGTEGKAADRENAKIATDMARIAFWKAQYDANPGAYVYASYTLDGNGNPQFDPTGKGAIGVVPVASVVASPSEVDVIPVPTITGGAIMQAVVRQPITFKDPVTGNTTVIGYALIYSAGGVQKTNYNVIRPDGTKVSTFVDPFATGPGSGVSETRDDTGIQISASIVQDNAATAATLDTQYGTEVAKSFADGAIPASGTTWSFGGTTVQFKDGQFSTKQEGPSKDANGNPIPVTSTAYVPVNPPLTAATLSSIWDQSRIIAGSNPTQDFQTPSMAALAESKSAGDAVINSWNSPAFQYRLQAEEIAASGGDPIKLRSIADADRLVAENLAAFGADKKHGLYEQLADAKDRKDLIKESLTQQTAPPAIKLGTEITAPVNPMTPAAVADPHLAAIQNSIAGYTAYGTVTKAPTYAPYAAPAPVQKPPPLVPVPAPSPLVPGTGVAPAAGPTIPVIPTSPTINAQTGFTIPSTPTINAQTGFTTSPRLPVPPPPLPKRSGSQAY